jgi:hypothetical protein
LCEKRKENQDKVQNLQPKIIESSSTILPSCLYLYLVYQPSKNNKVYHKTNPLFPTLSLCKTIFHPDEQSEACSISFRTVQKTIRQKARSFLDLLSNLLQAQH